MTRGPSHPDDRPEEGTQGPGKARPFDTWDQESSTEPTSPPGANWRPIEGTIPGFGSLSGSEIPSSESFGASESLGSSGSSDSHPAVESIGVQGTLQPGQVLFGRYLAEKLLGEGGMGTVWLVKHLELDTQRALKLIVSGIAFDPQAQARFKREARVMARLSHPHAVVVHDARMGLDAAFIEMEYIRGKSLNKAMSPGVPMPLDWIGRLLEQLCDVLEEAHLQKIVHRDLKPANLMLLDGRPAGREQLKVLDFGIAKILEGDNDTGDVHTHTGSFLGSAPYTSPEQASGGLIDGRSDIYSVGIILYEMLTGYRPFTGPITRLIYDHLYSLPPPFSERNPDCRVPEAVEAVVRRCLAKDPNDRPQSAMELLNEFRDALPEGYASDGHGPLPLTERDAPSRAPGRRTSSGQDAAGVRTQGLTDDSRRIPYESQNALPPTIPGYGFTQPSKPKSAVDSTDWKDQPVLPIQVEPAQKTLTRVIQSLLVVALLLGVGFAIYRYRSGRVANTPTDFPEGYAAAEKSVLVHGHPSVLVRTRDKARFLLLEGGTFKMGNDGFDPTGSSEDEDQPAHPVMVNDFWMQEFEVTNGEMEAYFIANRVDVADRPKRWTAACERIRSKGHEPAAYPAIGITHELAEKYASWVRGRLPTEAQWEYAARSQGKPNPYVWGSEPKPDLSNANVDSIGQVSNIPTFEVGEFPKDKTAQGLFDMTGNVREWCRDVWSPYVSSTTPLDNPAGPAVPESGVAEYVVRGGSFAYWKDRTRTTRPRRPDKDDLTSQDLAVDQTAEDLGFRVVIEVPKS